ncbi:MAG: hypothetical protein ACUZ8I_09240 [Candidatus Scalindua sp.]
MTRSATVGKVGIDSIWAMSVEVALEPMLVDPPSFKNIIWSASSPPERLAGRPCPRQIRCGERDDAY